MKLALATGLLRIVAHRAVVYRDFHYRAEAAQMPIRRLAELPRSRSMLDQQLISTGW
jgi:hypothetical protein